MVAEAHVAVDVENAVREWGRSVLNVPVFFGVNNKSTFPQVKVARVAGPDREALIQFDVWGGTKAEAATTAADLATALTALAGFVHQGTKLHGASEPSTRWLPDEQSDRPRYIVETVVHATSIDGYDPPDYYGGSY